MNCRWVQDRLLMDMAGELKHEEAKRIDAHLSHCFRCRDMVGILAETEAEVEAALQIQCHAPRELAPRVMGKLRNLPRPHPPQFWTQLFYRWKQRSIVLAGMALLVIIGYFAGYLNAGRRQLGASLNTARPATNTVLQGQKQQNSPEEKEVVKRRKRRPGKKTI